jgi:di/tricarboxylate transporter
MTTAQLSLILLLAAIMGLFIWNRWRYDVVAVAGLLTAVALGLVPAAGAFSGFGHPAVVTVAAVLIISQALQTSGSVDRLARLIAATRWRPDLQAAVICALTAVLSAFMNNIGALALMLPVALRHAGRSGLSPSKLMMPLAFASLLGGLVTLIGTPPNIVIAAARARVGGEPFGMFDFTPVGLTVMLAGLAFILLAGRRLLPTRELPASDGNRFRIKEYLIETRLPAGSPLVGADIRRLEEVCQHEATVMAIRRGKRRHLAPKPEERLEAGDLLTLEGDLLTLRPLLEGQGLVAVEDGLLRKEQLTSAEVQMAEAVVMPGAPIEGRSMRRLRIHETYGINLLAMARQGRPPEARLAEVRFEVGDVLLLQGRRELLQKVMPVLGCLPLAERGLNVARNPASWMPLIVFALAIAAAAFGLAPVQIAFVAAVLAIVLFRAIPLREVYNSIEWPVIVLLGALIPVGEALETSGATALIAAGIGEVAGDLPVWGLLALVMVTAMLMSDLIHNTPTAILMAPLGIGLARTLDIPVDAVLMAIAVGAASPYLTPIGHQSNTLVMGPGNYRFGDYWRLGLPLDAVIVLVAVPMILWIWMP